MNGVARNSVITPEEQMRIIREKHELIPKLMKETDIDCWIVFLRETSSSHDPVQELVIGGDVVWHSAFIFSSESEFRKIAIVGNFDTQHERQKGIWDEIIPYKEGISGPLLDVVAKLNPQKIALNFSEDDVTADGLSHGMYLTIERILSEFKSKFTSAAPIIQRLRSQKTVTELQLIKRACEIAEEINHKVTKHLKIGMTEVEIQQLYYELMDKEGVSEAWQRSNCPAVDAGPDKEFGHAGPTDLQIRKGHTLHNDFGVRYRGYCSDLQRMWFFGEQNELPDELRHAFETVKTAIRKAKSFIKPGVKGNEVDAVARNYVQEQGYEEYAHALGHQVGLQAHDGGVLLGPLWERYGDLPKGEVRAGNVFTLELYVKTKSYGMVSLEEMIVVTEEGADFIVPPTEDFIFISDILA